MKRKPHFFIVLATAAATLAILGTTLGAPKYMEHCKQFHNGCDQTEIVKK